MALIHATCVAIGDQGVLIKGPPGSGKSDLALRLIDDGGKLIADDYVMVANKDGHLIASPPKEIAGKMEVRGLGLVELPYRENVILCLVAGLCERDKVERYPDPLKADIEGLNIPLIRLWPFAASATAKIKIALAKYCITDAD